MSIKKPYLLILLFSFLFFVINEVSSFYISKSQEIQQVYKNDKKTFKNLQEAQRRNLSLLASMLAMDSVVIEAYETNNPQLIIEHFAPIWHKLKSEKLIYEIHFFKPPAISFVNFSNFKSIGKDLSKVRTDILWVSTAFEPSTHNFMCKTYAGIRATYPIFDHNGHLLGGLSLGVKLDWLPQSMKEQTNHDSFLVYNKAATKSLGEKYYKDFIKNKTIIGEYILANETMPIPASLIPKIDFSQKTQELEINGKNYVLNIFRLIDFNHQDMGYIITLNNLHTFYQQYTIAFIKNLMLIIITALIIFFITKKSLESINQELQKNLKMLNTAQKAAQMGSYTYNLKDHKINFSDELYRLLKTDKEHFVPSLENFIHFVHKKDRKYVYAMLNKALTLHKKVTFEHRVLLEDNTLYYVRSTAEVNEFDKNNQPQLLSGTVQNITEFKKLELENQRKSQEIIKQLYTDKLTKLPNRTALIRDMNNNEEGFLALLNIKSFRDINDLFGFDAGNYVLASLAEILSKICITEGITVYRIGNDEFALLSAKKYEQKAYLSVIDTLIETIEETLFVYNDVEISLSVYMGIVFSPNNRLSKADIALTQAKIRYKDYCIYTEEANTASKQKNSRETIQKVKEALNTHNILPYFQPIVNKEEKILKYESLVRLKEKDKVLSPYFFLETAQKTKYYAKITQEVLRATFEFFKEREESFSVNLIAQDILNEETLDFIKKLLSEFPQKERVVFEIVESEDIYSIEQVAEFIKNVQECGAKIAIDDFGTGYSNFSYMMQLKPNYIKLDGSLIKELDTNENARKIVKTIITFAQELGIKTIAEYVHSKEIFQLCKSLGVDEFQGYYFSEPLPAEKIL